MDPADHALIAALQDGRDWVWINGNQHRAAAHRDLADRMQVPGDLVGRARCGFVPQGESAGMDPADHALIAALQDGRDWVWINGNHDRAVQDGVGVTILRSSAAKQRRRTERPRIATLPTGCRCPAISCPSGCTAHLLGDGRIFAIGRAMLARD
jgi:hypothetical protein